MLSEFVDNYCERLGPGVWAEPLNFLSNGAFFLAAFLVWREMRTLPIEKRRPLGVAVGLLFLTGVGSSLFHSFATRWAELADVIPIGLFLLYYLWLFLAVLWEAPRRTVLKGFVAFIGATVLGVVLFAHPAFNRSQNYFGALGAMVAMAWATRGLGRGVSGYYWAASGAFLVALVFRSIDLHLCADWPLGTHFLWHASNGAVTYFVLKAALVWTRAKELLRGNSRPATA